MTLPGLETAAVNTRRTSMPLAQAAVDHVARLRGSGLLTPGLELRAALIEHLANTIAHSPAYAVAPLAAQLREAMDDLPEQGGDAWDALILAITAADICPNCRRDLDHEAGQ